MGDITKIVIYRYFFQIKRHISLTLSPPAFIKKCC